MNLYSYEYMDAFVEVCKNVIKKGKNRIENMVLFMDTLKKRGGRLFIIGVGGGASNADHAVNDFRRIANIDAYAPTNNIGELTAVTNDMGWEYVFIEWLKTSRIESKDGVMVFSVGGGSEETSKNIMEAVKYAKDKGAFVCGFVASKDGTTAKLANIVYILPEVEPRFRTAFIESMQPVLWHCIVNHPHLKGE